MRFATLADRKIGQSQQLLERSRPVLLYPEQHADEMGSGHRGWEYCRPCAVRSGPRRTARALPGCGGGVGWALLQGCLDPQRSLERRPNGIADHRPQTTTLELAE